MDADTHLSKSFHLRTLFIFGTVGFLANFFWESMHAFSLYQGHIIGSAEYIRMMIVVSAKDALLLLLVLAAGVGIFRNLQWYVRISPWEHVFIVAANIFLAVGIEVRALYFDNTWQYSDLMPTIFGVGVSPLLQLVVIWYLAWWIACFPNQG